MVGAISFFTKKLYTSYNNHKILLCSLSLWRFNAASCCRLVSQHCDERAEECEKYLFIHGNGADAEETDVHRVYKDSAAHWRLLWDKGDFTAI